MYAAKQEELCDENFLKEEIFQIKEEVDELSENSSNEFKRDEEIKTEIVIKEEHAKQIAKNHKCEFCEESFSDPSILNRHKQIHICMQTGRRLCLPYECDLCGKEFLASFDLTMHRKSVHAGEKPYKCEVCQKSFSEKVYLRKHKSLHAGEKPHKCDVCQKTFAEKDYLRKHKSVHAGEKPYKCEVCQKSFSDKNYLRKHKRIHSGERPYKCDVCEKAFLSSDHLKLHKRSHTGEKSFKCDLCEKAFSLKPNLLRHKKMHTGEKPFMCDICGHGFASIGELKKHTLVVHIGERPYICDICGQAFSSTSNLGDHKLRTHEKDNWHIECKTCNEKFYSVKRLKEHVRAHAGVRPYSCNICKKTFQQRDYVRRHVRQHHREDLSDWISQLNYDKSMDVPDTHECMMEYTTPLLSPRITPSHPQIKQTKS